MSDLETSRRTIEKEQSEINAYKREIEKLKRELDRKHEKLDEQKERILREANEKANAILREAKEVADEIVIIYNRSKSAKNVSIYESFYYFNNTIILYEIILPFKWGIISLFSFANLRQYLLLKKFGLKK